MPSLRQVGVVPFFPARRHPQRGVLLPRDAGLVKGIGPIFLPKIASDRVHDLSLPRRAAS